MERYSIDGRLVPTINGGAGSGNFGHAGRPGKRGGSAPTSSAEIGTSFSTIASSEQLEKYREYLKSRGYTDEWVDEQKRIIDRENLKKKADKAKTKEEFQKVLDEMDRESGRLGDFETWKEVNVKYYMDKLSRDEELKRTVKTANQEKAVNELLNIGTDFSPAAAKWAKENLSENLARELNSALQEANKDGLRLDKSLKVDFGASKRHPGLCAFNTKTNQIVVRFSKEYLKDETDLRNRCAKNAEKKWWTSGETKGLFTHELGHALTWVSLQKQGVSVYQFDRYCSKIVGNANARMAKYIKSQTPNVELARNSENKYISRYGQKKSAEVIAESFANPNYSKYTEIVVEELRKVL